MGLKNRTNVLLIIGFIVLMANPMAGHTRDQEVAKYINEVAPEFVLKKEDFTYLTYGETLKKLNQHFKEWNGQKNPSPSPQMVVLKEDWALLHIGLPNYLLSLKGYGLISQKEILELRLENAKLKKLKSKTINDLRNKLQEVDKQIKIFLTENHWVD